MLLGANDDVVIVLVSSHIYIYILRMTIHARLRVSVSCWSLGADKSTSLYVSACHNLWWCVATLTNGLQLQRRVFDCCLPPNPCSTLAWVGSCRDRHNMRHLLNIVYNRYKMEWMCATERMEGPSENVRKCSRTKASPSGASVPKRTVTIDTKRFLFGVCVCDIVRVDGGNFVAIYWMGTNFKTANGNPNAICYVCRFFQTLSFKELTCQPRTTKPTRAESPHAFSINIKRVE